MLTLTATKKSQLLSFLMLKVERLRPRLLRLLQPTIGCIVLVVEDDDPDKPLAKLSAFDRGGLQRNFQIPHKRKEGEARIVSSRTFKCQSLQPSTKTGRIDFLGQEDQGL